MDKIKLIWISIVGFLTLIFTSIISIFVYKKMSDKKITHDMFNIDKNKLGTQILPNTPELDETLSDIKKDIIN